MAFLGMVMLPKPSVPDWPVKVKATVVVLLAGCGVIVTFEN